MQSKNVLWVMTFWFCYNKLNFFKYSEINKSEDRSENDKFRGYEDIEKENKII